MYVARYANGSSFILETEPIVTLSPFFASICINLNTKYDPIVPTIAHTAQMMATPNFSIISIMVSQLIPPQERNSELNHNCLNDIIMNNGIYDDKNNDNGAKPLSLLILLDINQ